MLSTEVKMCKFMKYDVNQIQTNHQKFNGEFKVTQPETKSELEARVEALEKKVYKDFKSEKKVEELSGPAEIRTQDPRRVKAMS